MTSIEPNVSPAGPVLLVAEDSESDRLILREAFNDLGVTVRLRFVVHGEDILDYLHGRAGL
jgi:CheY-like chemotaxis protein